MNRIPYARGLGSSSAAIVGGIIAGLMLSGHRLSCWGAEELLQIACDIEGHPDNVAPVKPLCENRAMIVETGISLR